MHAFIQVSTTFDRKQDAEKAARLLVEKRLVACVQVIGPMESTYWWQGEVEKQEEWLCLMKTRSDLYEALEKELKSAHPYDEPEVIALPVLKGSEGYLRWIDKETSGDS